MRQFKEDLMNRHKILLALLVLLLLGETPLVAAQHAAKVYQIGILSSETASGYTKRLEALRSGLHDLGYVEGRNIVIEFRWAEGQYDRLPGMAAELVRLKPDVLVTFGIKAALEAKRVTTTVPIVIPATADAVATGLVARLARPEGNITGSTYFGTQLMAKRLEILMEAVPRITQAAVLLNPANPSFEAIFQAMEIPARSLKVGLQSFEVRAPKEFDRVFAALAKKRVDAIAILEDTMFTVNAKGIADLAAKNRLPSTGNMAFAEAGGLIGYGPSQTELFRRAATFVDKILRGASPSDIPMEQATKFELLVNLKTSKALGLTIPPVVLLRADQVIE
jgi:putative ABC transport system substrate-binding protein